MWRLLGVCVLILAALLWAAGASALLFAESWWRVIGVALFPLGIPLTTLARRGLRRPEVPAPSQ